MTALYWARPLTPVTRRACAIVAVETCGRGLEYRAACGNLWCGGVEREVDFFTQHCDGCRAVLAIKPRDLQLALLAKIEASCGVYIDVALRPAVSQCIAMLEAEAQRQQWPSAAVDARREAADAVDRLRASLATVTPAALEAAAREVAAQMPVDDGIRTQSMPWGYEPVCRSAPTDPVKLKAALDAMYRGPQQPLVIVSAAATQDDGVGVPTSVDYGALSAEVDTTDADAIGGEQ